MESGRNAVIPRVAFRVSLSLMEIGLRTATEFYEHTARSLQDKLRTIERDYAALPKSERERDLGDGMTEGELASGQHYELEVLSQINGYFGILAVYSVFERCLLCLFRDAQRLELVKEKRYQKAYLTLDGYEDFFKTIGISLNTATFKWDEIRKLQLFRNAIAHHGGLVMTDHATRLKSYGYKVGDTIRIDKSCFHSSVELVRETCSVMIRMYDRVQERATRPVIPAR